MKPKPTARLHVILAREALLESLLSPEETADGKRRAQAWLAQREKPSTDNR